MASTRPRAYRKVQPGPDSTCFARQRGVQPRDELHMEWLDRRLLDNTSYGVVQDSLLGFEIDVSTSGTV